MYELFIEGLKVDIDQKISIQLTFALDDIANYGSRETSFSKTIVLPGTGRNNQIFGYIYDISSFNYELPGGANIGSVFNAAQTSRAELRLNGLLVLKGVFRIVNIIKDKDIIEYEGALFGELTGFIGEIGNNKLEELDFSSNNHTYTISNIINSWNTVNGSGYYYPLIDYGTYSTPEKNNIRTKVDYDYRTFRPAFYIKEYIDKIFDSSGYRYQSDFFNSSFFKKLIIPNNASQLKKKVTKLLDALSPNEFTLTTTNVQSVSHIHQFQIINVIDNLTGNGDPNFTYTSSPTEVNINFVFKGEFYPPTLAGGGIRVQLFINNTAIFNFLAVIDFRSPQNSIFGYRELNYTTTRSLQNNDTIKVVLFLQKGGIADATLISKFISLKIESTNPIDAPIELGDNILASDILPRNILQKDFFTWIIKMFNLYVVEDKLDEKLLHIIPYKDYLSDDIIDWTYKIARDKPWQIKPMGVLNSRFFEYKYKEDNDFYNENFKKKYNLPYGYNLFDTGFDFSKDKQVIEVGFSPTVLIQYEGTNQRTKILPAIYKKSSGNSVDQEERMDSNIRVLMAKKMTTSVNWYITDNNISGAGKNLSSPLTSYGYAGHFDDPINPTVDINFGSNKEIYFDPNVYPSENLFNTYWSSYIAEIIDKDSKLVSCYARLNALDIAQLDFSKPIMIDGVLFRLNKVEDYDYKNDELVKVELLKIINYNPPCAIDWTKQNYTGTRFRNGDEIPQVTNVNDWLNLTTPAWCYYNNDPANEATYGKLYNWYAINDPRGFAPLGYRVPSDSDWDDLITCLGGTSVAGGKMKSIEGWTAPNTGATNESGFSALGAGLRGSGGFFINIGTSGRFWASNEVDSTNAKCRQLSNTSGEVTNVSINKKSGLSVRLIKE